MVQSELTNRLGFETKFSEKFEDLNRMNKDKEELKLIITQLIISQEQKNEIIKEYSLQIMKLNNDLRDKENEILVKNEVISRLKNKINEKKHKNIYNKQDFDLPDHCLTTTSEKAHSNISNNINKTNIKFIDKYLSAKSLIKLDNSVNQEKNVSKDTGNRLRSSNMNKRILVKKVFINNINKSFKDNNDKMQIPSEFYDKLSLFHQIGKENLSILTTVNGNLKDFGSVRRVLDCSGMKYMEVLLEKYENYEIDKKNIHKYYDKIDQICINLKSIINDFRSTLHCVPKINYLLSVLLYLNKTQSLFCEKILLDDIFIRFSNIFNNLIDSEISHLFILDKFSRELYTVLNKTEKYFKFKVSEYELLGQVIKKKSVLNIDNVLNDKRYDPLIDNKFNYGNIRSIYFYPIVNSENEVIAIIQAFNKRYKYFDQTDEVFIDNLAKLVQLQIQQSLEYSDLSVYINKMKKFLDSIHYLFLEENQLSIIRRSFDVLKSILISVKSQIIFLSKTGNKFYKYNEEDTPSEVYLTNGIIGQVYKKKFELFVEDTAKNKYYNCNLDLMTSSSLITKPVFDLYSNEILAIIQAEYTETNHNININVLQNKEIKYLDQEILTLFCSCLSKALTINRKNNL